MAQLDTSKLNFDSENHGKTECGNYQWKDKSQEEVIWVPNENGKFLMQIR